MKQLLLITFLATTCRLLGQPGTEVYLFDILEAETAAGWLGNPVNISDNPGYDNQPSFWPDGKSVLYARTVGNQTEIARYAIENGPTITVTSTRQGSEYSPTPMPDGNISSIRLDTRDCNCSTRIHKMAPTRCWSTS